MRHRSLRFAAALLAVAIALLTAAAAATRAPGDAAGEAGEPAVDPLAELGLAATSGAAPGYLPDETCGLCHGDLYAAYQEVGMARSFFRPTAASVIEEFDRPPYHHEELDRYYEMDRVDGRYRFRRYQLDADGEPIHVFETDVDWILGSGNHARTYLYQTELGELYQLPLAWYTRTDSWGMAPGFELEQHFGVVRPVTRECMFCHNAYPEVPAGSDGHFAPDRFPHELPEGTGCQRCHGPGADHVRTVLRGEAEPKRIRETIVNPARLEPQRRDDVCYQCHMQPSIALFGVRRFGRGDYSYRPGEPLPDYVLKMDVTEEGQARSERFEINHHPYRLEQSHCFRESEGALSCLTCHDPHRKVPPAERAAHYREACLGCHELAACDLQHMSETEAVSYPDVEPGNCVGCHMPKRRTQDVVEVVMTDHKIRREPGGPELLAPLEQEEAILVDIHFQDPARAPEGPEGEIYKAIAVLRAGGGANALDHLQTQLARLRPTELTPYLEAVRAELRLGRHAAARETLEKILERAPEHVEASHLLGVTLGRLGRRRAAVAAFERALELDPERPVTHYNLGRLLSGLGEREEGVGHLEEAVRLRPNFALVWQRLGDARRDLERSGAAEAAYRRALAIEPTFTAAYVALGRALLERGEREEALRLLRHGAEVALRPGKLEGLLERLEAASPEERRGD